MGKYGHFCWTLFSIRFCSGANDSELSVTVSILCKFCRMMNTGGMDKEFIFSNGDGLYGIFGSGFQLIQSNLLELVSFEAWHCS